MGSSPASGSFRRNCDARVLVKEVVRTTNEIREELDQAIARRAELWNRLSQGSDAETSAELAGLSKTIDNALQRVKRKVLQHQQERAVLD